MFLLNTPELYAQASQDVMGSTAPHVNVSTIKNYALAIPDRIEQDAIIAQLRELTVNFAQTIDTARQEINLVNAHDKENILSPPSMKMESCLPYLCLNGWG